MFFQYINILHTTFAIFDIFSRIFNIFAATYLLYVLQNKNEKWPHLNMMKYKLIALSSTYVLLSSIFFMSVNAVSIAVCIMINIEHFL